MIEKTLEKEDIMIVKKTFWGYWLFFGILSLTFIGKPVWGATYTREVKIKFNVEEKNGKFKETFKFLVNNRKTDKWILKKTDQVTIYFNTQVDSYHKIELDIEYKISDYETDKSTKEVFKQMLGEPKVETKPSAPPGKQSKEKVISVEDDLKPGGIIIVVFKMTEIKPKELKHTLEGKTFTIVLDKSKNEVMKRIYKFKIKDRFPFFFTSTGIVFSNENNRKVEIINTDETITYEKDGETKEAQKQMIIYRGDNTKIAPKQTLVQFFHFNIWKPVYISLGIPLNMKIFTQPMIGLTGYLKFKNIGAALTMGAQFHKELYILEDSCYYNGYIIEPPKTVALENISVEDDHYVIRPFLGISFKF